MIDFVGSISIIYFINICMVFVIIFMERKDPTATLAWALVLLIFPGVGFVLFLLLSQNFSKKKLFSMQIYAKKTFGEYLKTQQELFNSGKIIFNDVNIENYKDMIKMNLFVNRSSYTQNNNVEILVDGHDKFSELFKCIERAKNHVHIQYYIIKNDNLSNRLFSLLSKKAQQGVEVRLLYDSVGGRHVSEEAINRLKHSGVKVGKFFSSKLPINFKMNYRNHRKIVVVDGKDGFIGGFNVGDEYLGLNKHIGYWRDTHMKITGDAVIDLQTRFFLDWSHATNEELVLLPRYFPDTNNDGSVGIQIISSGPDKTEEIIKQNYVKMINLAKKSIYIQTPYFIPDESVRDALIIAAKSGVDVNVMIPCKPDHPFVYWATYWYCGDLLKYGVKIYIYENGFLHAKTIISDDSISSVGTANFDERSFRLNFEVNALIYDTDTTKKLKETFNNDLQYSYQLTREMYLDRTITIKFKESISRLFAPLL